MKTLLNNPFTEVPDPRVTWRCKHKLSDVLFIGFCTLLSNGEDFEDMAEFGNQRRDWLEDVLELPNGIPSHDTFNRVFQMIDPQAFNKSLTLGGEQLLKEVRDKLISLDGKKLKAHSPT